MLVGNNEVTFNEASMINILQEWFDKNSTFMVVVDGVKTDGREGFKISIKDLNLAKSK